MSRRQRTDSQFCRVAKSESEEIIVIRVQQTFCRANSDTVCKVFVRPGSPFLLGPVERHCDPKRVSNKPRLRSGPPTFLLDEHLRRQVLATNLLLLQQVRDHVEQLLRLRVVLDGDVAACGDEVICCVTPEDARHFTSGTPKTNDRINSPAIDLRHLDEGLRRFLISALRKQSPRKLKDELWISCQRRTPPGPLGIVHIPARPLEQKYEISPASSRLAAP